MKAENPIEQLLPLLRDERSQRKAFAELVRLTGESLYRHIRRIVLVHEDADDVLQNTYIKAWRSLAGFKGDSALFTWLYRIATNEALTFLSRRRMESVPLPEDYEDIMLSRLEADPYYDGDAMQLKLQQAILTLPEKQRLVFNMRYFDQKSYAEIAAITGTSEGALKASYHIATKKIESFIRSTDDI